VKFLRNPIIVAILGVLAVALVVNAMWPLIRGNRRGRAAAPAPAPVVSSVQVSAPATESAKPAAIAGAGAAPSGERAAVERIPSDIELAIVRRDAARWAKGARDPFQIRSTPTKPVYPRAMEVLTLSAIWRQTDSSLAVLNNQIYTAGDTVLRFLIKSIEADRVWVQGPNGREVVEFKPGPVMTNAQPNMVSMPVPPPSAP
jgi:hypothetical protein